MLAEDETYRNIFELWLDIKEKKVERLIQVFYVAFVNV